MKNLLFLIQREFGLFWANKVFVAAFLVMPLVLSFVLGMVYIDGKVSQLPIVIVDKDDTPTSARFCDMLADNYSLNVVQTTYETVNLHQELLNTRAVAIVVVPYRFEAGILTGKDPEINCYLNMANTLTAGAAGGAITTCAGTFNAGILMNTLQKKGVPPGLASQQYEAFRHNVFLQYNRTGNYLSFLWPGLIFSILHQLLLLAMAVSFSQEFVSGNFSKQGLLAKSSSPVVLIFVKIFPYLIMSLFTLTSYYLLSAYFRIPPPQHPFVLFISQLLFLLSTYLLGCFYSIANPIPVKATQLLMSIASPAFTLSGFSWPANQEPALLRAISEIIPLTPFLKILRMTLVQGASLQDVLPYINHELLLTGVYFLLSFLLLKVKITKTLRNDSTIQLPMPA